MQTTQDTQDAPAEILFKLWPWLEENKTPIVVGIAALVVVIAGYSFVVSQRDAREQEAGAAFSQLLMTPLAGAGTADAMSSLASKYDGTMAAQRAQLLAADTYFSMGRYSDAETAFQKFVTTKPQSPLISMAQLGLAASLEAEGKLDVAAAAYQKVASVYGTTPSSLPAHYALGRIAEAQGRLREAQDNYTTVARSGQMGGSLAQDAGIHAQEIANKIAAMPKPAATTTPATPGAPVTPAPMSIPSVPAAK